MKPFSERIQELADERKANGFTLECALIDALIVAGGELESRVRALEVANEGVRLPAGGVRIERHSKDGEDLFMIHVRDARVADKESGWMVIALKREGLHALYEEVRQALYDIGKLGI